MKALSLHRLSLAAIAAIAVIAAATSCRSAKEPVATDGISSASTPVAATTTPGATAAAWHDLYIPVSVELRKPVAMSVSGRVTMVRDSAIFVSMRVFGMEVATIYANTDSVTVADKYHSYVYTEPLSAITARDGLTMADLQDILLGRRQVPASCPASVTLAPAVACGAGGTMSPEVTVSTPLGGKDVTAALRWDTRKAQWDTNRQIKPTNTKGYRRLQRSDILQILKF